MKRGLRRSAVLLFGLIVIFQFNNCGVYESQQPDASLASTLTDCESDTECVTKSNVNLKITPLPVDNFPVIPTLAAFNVGGDCNEAGYPTHRITWILKRNNVSVRTSGMIVHGKSWHSECVNGKFRLYVNLAAIPEDNVNRTGLLYGSGTARAAYDLEVEILALENGVWLRNVNQGGMKKVNLVPVN